MLFNQSIGHDVLESRRRWRQQAECQFLEAHEFLSLALSNRKLLKSDVPLADLKGLTDPETGIRYMVEEELLLGM